MVKKGTKRSKAGESPTKSSSEIFSTDPVADIKTEKGALREYVVTTPTAELVKNRKVSKKESILLAILAIAGLSVRLSSLETPDSVVFDEVHFGGFARKYIQGAFFMDVHPPLAKMMFAAIALIGGFKGDFEFTNIGDQYPSTTPYKLMRGLSATLGLGTVFLCYLTLRNSGIRPIIAFLTSALLLIENANVTISRYVLLDSPLLFFIAAAVYALKKFEIQTPFSFAWYKSLLACGIGLGLAVSSKWVGLFTIAWVGISCIYQMWFIIGDLSIPSNKVVAHAFARGSILLGVPFVLYVTFFGIHFKVLSNDGDGSAFMSSAFKAGLNGNTIPRDITANVGFGSIVSIRHVETLGGYLHSHNHFYPAGSKQQQVTLYPHLDSNNNWLIEPYNSSMPDHFVPLENGVKIRLKHVNTGRRLHSHDEKPPVSERDWQKEVSCYGYEDFEGDANDDFIVEIVQKASAKGEAQNIVRPLQSIFRLKHAMTGHYLFSSEVKLPEWGFDQQEVTCSGQGYRPLTNWYIETNENQFVNDTEREIINYPKLTLWEKIVESHKRMWKINQGLVEHHHWQSEPSEWPVLYRGINYWVKDHRQVYLLGNAVTWWSSTLGIIAFFIHCGFSLVRWQLGRPIAVDKHVYNFNAQTFSFVAGWLLHFGPFYIMKRQLFMHHYIPALYFAILALGHYFELFVGYTTAGYRSLQTVSHGVLALVFVLSLVFYNQYSSLIYGTPWTKQDCEKSKLLSSWDFECNAFLDSISNYSTTAPSFAPDLTDYQAVPVEGQADRSEAKETPFAPAEKIVDEDIHQSEMKEAENSEEAKGQVEELAPPLAVDLEETK